MASWLCKKHNTKLTLFCNKCNTPICPLCAKEHEINKHDIEDIVKHADKWWAPRVRLTAEQKQSVDAQKEQNAAYNKLASLCNELIEKKKAQIETLQSAISTFEDPSLRPYPNYTLQGLAFQLDQGIASNDVDTVLTQWAAFADFQEQTEIDRVSPHQVTLLNEQLQNLLSSSTPEDKFFHNLATLQKSFQEPIVHSLQNVGTGLISLYNISTQRYVARSIVLPENIQQCWVSTTTIKHKIYFSGGTSGSTFLNTTYEITVKPDMSITQNKLANMPVAKYAHTLASIQDSFIFSLGGSTTEYLKTCELYTLSADSWMVISPLNCPRVAPAACPVSNTFMYCFGGYVTDDTFIERTNVEDPDLKWEIMGMKSPIDGLSNAYAGRAVPISSASVLIFCKGQTQVMSVIYDAFNDQLERLTVMPESETEDIFAHSVPVKCGDNVYVVGTMQQNLHIYSISTNTWTLYPYQSWASDHN